MSRFLLFVCPVILTALSVTVRAGASSEPPSPPYWDQAGANPTHRSDHAMAYDEARGRVVLFGGLADGAQRMNDTWEWDGERWRRTATAGPPARNTHAMAYDSARQRIVLFGGLTRIDGTLTPLDDTWEWDGDTWHEVETTTRPPARSDHAMAYDSARDRVVLFGGRPSVLDPPFADTWEWDGTQWHEITPEAAPPARHSHAMAFDASRGRTVLFGGVVEITGGINDTWEWDGTQWHEVVAASAPFADPSVPMGRGGHALVYDGARQYVLLFGGFDAIANRRGDTWAWDGEEWTEPWPFGPSARTGHAMAYDEARGHIVLFGGYDGSRRADTHEWTGASWHAVQDFAPSPSARDAHAMAHDSSRGRTVLFGGSDETTRLNDTWEWDGTRWHLADPGGDPGKGVIFPPPPRSGHAMVYDEARERVVLFGGAHTVNGAVGFLGDTWEWNGSAWVQRTTPQAPPERANHSMAYDSTRQRTVLFGGVTRVNGGIVRFNDVWEWDGDEWHEVTPQQAAPEARDNAAMVFDSARNRTVLFGGASEGTFYNDTWLWDGTTWEKVEPVQMPAGRNLHAMAYDSVRRRTVLFGGMTPEGEMTGTLMRDTWEFDGRFWHHMDTGCIDTICPEVRALHATAYDSNCGRVVLFGGYPRGQDPGGVWEYFGPEPPEAGITASGSTDYPPGIWRIDHLAERFGGHYVSAVIDEANGYAYFGTSNGRVLKLRLGDDDTGFPTVTSVQMDPEGASLTSAVIDPGAGYAYFGTSTDPARVLKVALGEGADPPALVHELVLDNGGLADFRTAVIDTGAGFAYFGSFTTNPTVAKIHLGAGDAPPSLAGTVTFPAPEHFLGSAVIDPAFGFAYFGTMTDPANVVAVITGAGASPPFRQAAIQFDSQFEESDLAAAVFDEDNGFAYFGTARQPGRVLKLEVARGKGLPPPPGSTESIPLEPGEDNIRTAVIDSGRGFAYFGTGTEPGRVVKIKLGQGHELPTRLTAATLLEGEDNLLASVIDTQNRFAYFGTSGNPARIVRVALTGQRGVLKGTRMELDGYVEPTDMVFHSHEAKGNVRLAIYSASEPKQLLWESGVIPNTVAGGELTVPIPQGTHPNLSLAPGTYWLAWQTDTIAPVPGYTPGEPGDGFYFPMGFGAPPQHLSQTDITVTAETWTQYLLFADPQKVIPDAARTLGDFNTDGCTDFQDFIYLLENWGEVVDGAPIGFSDFVALLENWGQGC